MMSSMRFAQTTLSWPGLTRPSRLSRVWPLDGRLKGGHGNRELLRLRGNDTATLIGGQQC